MRRLAPWALVLLPACLSGNTRELPPNIGQTHEEGHTGSARVEAPEAEPEPVPVGTLVWAEHRSTSFYHHGVVVERRADGDHRVIFADGDTEWVGPAALRPDSLGAEAQVQVRPSYDHPFSEGVVSRRVGDAVYVRLASGDERWAALSHVRFETDDEGVPRRGDAPVPPAEAGLTPGGRALVDYGQNGLRFVATVTARSDEGQLHVVYLDSTTEWVDASQAEPESLVEGDLVHVRRRWEPPDWVRGRIQVRHAHALSVELDDGGIAWTSLFRVRMPVAREGAQSQSDATPEQLPAESQERQEPQSGVTATGSTRISMGERASGPIATVVHP